MEAYKLQSNNEWMFPKMYLQEGCIKKAIGGWIMIDTIDYAKVGLKIGLENYA